MRALGEMQQSANSSACESQQYFVSSCWCLHWSYYTPLNCTNMKLAAFGCLGTVVCQTLVQKSKQFLQSQEMTTNRQQWSCSLYEHVSTQNTGCPRLHPRSLLSWASEDLSSLSWKWRQITHTACVGLKQPVHIFFYHEIRFLADTRTVDTFNYPSCFIHVPTHQAPFSLPFSNTEGYCRSSFCWCILFDIVEMSGLSHWHNFVVLMFLFGYTIVYSVCCCESHNLILLFLLINFITWNTWIKSQLLVDLISYLTDGKVLV